MDKENILVPAGEFTMGADAVMMDDAIARCQKQSAYEDCETTYKENASLRSVFLEMYYIDKYEVTNAEYQKCVSSQNCSMPKDTKLGAINYFGNTKYAAYPVIWVTREQAKQYCASRNAYLPSAAEWEKAARGTDRRVYPWGNEANLDSRVNGRGSNDGFPYTAPVGSFSLGVSPYGAFDMAGNVSEYVDESVSITYFVYRDNATNIYTYDMTRGGSYYEFEGVLKTYEIGSGFGWINTGFRCARDATP